MKKKLKISLGIILVLALAIVSYKLIASNSIKDKTYSHLETIGYTQNDIDNVEIKHSFLNKLLGYNEWRIFVEFESEPDIIFAFTYRDKQIIRQGITSKVTQLDIAEIEEYDSKFDNGELKNN
ncbi:hypothetical protein MCJ35_10710 [Enterocloster sp. OA13]|uniref:hypothetical protein n=1 Tax=Enterocloster sp. OA13 TaxID=2914161 RepID=UPI0004718DA2|nr:hypothetical protein [Enterocloster sp. OA13]